MNENSTSTTIKSWLDQSTRLLQNAGITTARLDSEIILSHTLRQPRTWLHSHGDDPLDYRTIDIASARIDLRLDRVPVAYIIGHKEFYGHVFKVSTATLIPRPESESLIDLLNDTIDRIPQQIDDQTRLVDVGTGSGNLGITAKLLYPELHVTLIDQSRHALSIAEKNARLHDVDVDILASDLLTNYPHTADIILANLPYVDHRWQRSPETSHEPAEALFADEQGLGLIYRLLEQTDGKLRRGGYLILEADPVQHEKIKRRASSYGLLCSQILDYGLLFEKIR